MNEAWIPAEAALALLGIARQTLYAYVSRGLLRTRPDPAAPRRSLYERAGIMALTERRARGRARHAVAASTIDFGEPVLESAITRIADGQLHYRGRDAIALSETATLEEVAALLWQAGALPPLPPSGHVPDPALPPLARCMCDVAVLAAPGSWGRSQAALLGDAAFLLRRMGEAACGIRADAPLHLVLARAWNAGPEAAALIRRALVLSADHELNASTFAVRVVASTGAALAACLLGGLAALSGPLHGGATERVAAMFDAPGMKRDSAGAIAARLARGETVPGFGHRLYPEGDPRAVALLAAFRPDPPWRRLFAAVADQAGLHPNIDAALVALQRTLRLPEGAPLAIFATGRAAGWIAHALEQQRDGRLIRPRASYVSG
jgi:citrate synthase